MKILTEGPFRYASTHIIFKVNCILFICLLCIETKLAWHCTLPFAHLYIYTNFKCKFEPLHIQHHHYLSLKKLYVSILRRITFITICTYRTSELRKNILEIQNY